MGDKKTRELITCPICAFFKVLQGTAVTPVAGDFTKGTRTVANRPKWEDFDETVKSCYLKSTQANRKDVADFVPSSEEIIPEGLTDFIEDEEKKKKEQQPKKGNEKKKKKNKADKS